MSVRIAVPGRGKCRGDFNHVSRLLATPAPPLPGFEWAADAPFALSFTTEDTPLKTFQFVLAMAITIALASMALAAPPAAPRADPTAQWLNGVRGRHGLRGCVYDAALAGDAAVNSQIQTRRGLGHFYMGHALRQDSGWGSLPAVMNSWLGSPPHLAAIIDPRVTRYGLAGAGAYWTLNLR